MPNLPRKQQPMIRPRRKNDPLEVGKFRIIGHLGTGGFGTVYVAARQKWSNELVAVKVVHPQLAEKQTFRERFKREIRAIKRVNSAYVPRLVAEDADDEAPWLATELIRGPSLHQVIRQCGPLPEPAVWQLGLGIAEALTAIHQAGLAHRDFKPGNVLIVPEGPRVIDFSLVHLAELDHGSSSRLYMGSYEYAPAEQMQGLQYAGQQADVFALGGTLLFAATGHPPYSTREQAYRAEVDLADLPFAFYDVVSQCLNTAERARPELPELKELFTSQARGRRGHQNAFLEALPGSVTNLIGAWRRDLSHVVHARGNARSAMQDAWNEWQELAPTKVAGAGRPAEEAPRSARRGGMTIIQPETVVPLPVGPDARFVRWRQQFRDWLRAPVAVAANLAAAASLDGTVAFFTADSGDLLWAASLGAPVTSAVALPPRGQRTGRRVYVGDAEGGVHAMEVASKEHRELFRAASAIAGPPVAVADHVYALSTDGCVYQIDARTSSHQLLFELGGPALGALTVADGVLFAADAEGFIHAVDIHDRRERWRLDVGGLVHSAPVVMDRWLYFSGTDGLLWSVDIDDLGERATVGVGAPVHTAPLYDSGRLYVGGSDGVVRAFDVSGDHAGRPKELWPRPPKVGEEVSGMAAAHGRIYVATDGMLVELDGGTGQQGVRLPVGSSVTAAPAAAGSFLYVAGLDGVVSCLSMS
jgi:eukaryotic-like serine/threonine-protein kinase